MFCMESKSRTTEAEANCSAGGQPDLNLVSGDGRHSLKLFIFETSGGSFELFCVFFLAKTD